MIRTLTLTAAAALALAVTPAHATTSRPSCVSADTRCQSYSCPTGTKTIFDNGFTDTGPWIVICL